MSLLEMNVYHPLYKKNLRYLVLTSDVSNLLDQSCLYILQGYDTSCLLVLSGGAGDSQNDCPSRV